MVVVAGLDCLELFEVGRTGFRCGRCDFVEECCFLGLFYIVDLLYEVVGLRVLHISVLYLIDVFTSFEFFPLLELLSQLLKLPVFQFFHFFPTGAPLHLLFVELSQSFLGILSIFPRLFPFFGHFGVDLFEFFFQNVFFLS